MDTASASRSDTQTAAVAASHVGIPARALSLTAARILFLLFAAATCLHIGWVMYHEPFAYDAWNMAVDTQGQPISWSRFWTYVRDQYAHSNPRFGQILTYLSYKTVWFAPLATPIAWFALAKATVAIALRRLPSWHRQRDLALLTLAAGFAWFAMPDIGKILFCRAYSANYVIAAAIQLWFVAVLFIATAPSRWALAAYALLGVIAGMCNEHTGPAIVLGAVLLAWYRKRQHQSFTLPLVAVTSFLVGFAAIFFAPGQDQRYDAAATKVSLVGRLLQRGVTGNLDIYRNYIHAIAPLLLVLLAILAVAATATRNHPHEQRLVLARVGGVAMALAAGSLITMTVFVSPKLGPRFYLHACALLLAAVIGVADAVLRRRQFLPFLLLAIFASGYAAFQTVGLYPRLAAQSQARLAQLAANAGQPHPGALVTVEGWDQVDESWWFLGDDFRDAKKRELVASYFGLRGVVFRGSDLGAPLGLSDVRLVPKVTMTPAACLDDVGGLQIGAFRGHDIASLHQAIKAAAVELQRQLPTASKLDGLDVAVRFIGDAPRLPRAELFVARWHGGQWFTPVAAMVRQGVSKTRAVKLPNELATQDWDIYVYQVGGEFKRLGSGVEGTTLTYRPWRGGRYWALACNAQWCQVIATTRHNL